MSDAPPDQTMILDTEGRAYQSIAERGPYQRAQSVRKRIGMVFQKPNPFPAMTVYDNVASGLKLAGIKVGNRDEVVEVSLRRAGLWNEMRRRLRTPGGALSGGQQQRLCIAWPHPAALRQPPRSPHHRLRPRPLRLTPARRTRTAPPPDIGHRCITAAPRRALVYHRCPSLAGPRPGGEPVLLGHE